MKKAETLISNIKKAGTQEQMHDMLLLSEYGGNPDLEMKVANYVLDRYNFHYSPIRNVWLTDKTVPKNSHGGVILLTRATLEQAKQFVLSAIANL